MNNKTMGSAMTLSAALALAGAPAVSAAAHHGARPRTAHTTVNAAPVTTTDVRCLLISRLLMQSGDPSRQSMGAAGSLYYSARLQARMTDVQIESALVADAQRSPPAPDQTRACGDRLDTRMHELEAMSQRVDSRLDVLAPRKAAPPSPAATGLSADGAATAPGGQPMADPAAAPTPLPILPPQGTQIVGADPQ